ncbi:hypothetical protein DFQ05_0930 [Winogradskyella wandonensis]|uniref:Uncharacterized protein n=1 Tax=Winogradskyella wandonensis TaxID=1442586 RepID=A0A4R1KZD6_9FLAO|nr:hypothetical protein [Winogradskyella wandonensis]TCK69409.1 hypothetical protein DFQ05_0930 [Winogradskyella wandonensis]
MSKISEKPLVSTKQEVQLVEGQFTCSEASFVINELINEKINFHKLQRLRLCEGDENSDTRYANKRIAELENEKLIAKSYIDKARKEGYDVFIDGVLEIRFVKK